MARQNGNRKVVPIRETPKKELINLGAADKMAVRALIQEEQTIQQLQQQHLQNKAAVIADIAKRYGVPVESIGTEYLLTADALIPQEKKEPV